MIDRANRARWDKEGRPRVRERAAREVERLIERYNPPRLREESGRELTRRMGAEARRYGMEKLPALT